MKQMVISWTLILLSGFGWTKEGLVLSVLYDDRASHPSTHADWGFSCLISGMKEEILFDSGAQWEILAGNAKIMGIDLSQLKKIVLSHHHPDAVGALPTLLEELADVKVYAVFSTPKPLVFAIEEKLADVVPVGLSQEICEDVHSTGELGFRIKEQALILDADPGMVILTGCAHPGIVTVVSKAKEMLNRPVYMVLGGFHLCESTDSEILQVIAELKQLGDFLVGPVHCSGDRGIALFREHFADRFVEVGAGSIFRIPPSKQEKIEMLSVNTIGDRKGGGAR